MSETLVRYGVSWRGPNDMVVSPMFDGYWTPFHIAEAQLREKTEENERLSKFQSMYSTELVSARAEVKRYEDLLRRADLDELEEAVAAVRSKPSL